MLGELTIHYAERRVARVPAVFFRSGPALWPYRLNRPLTHRHSLRTMLRCFLSRES